MNDKNNISTRSELWKNYRDEINENIVLEKALFNSNEKLKIILNRVKKVYPSFEKNNLQENNNKANLQKNEEIKFLSNSKIKDMINSINKLENDENVIASTFDDLDLSTRAFDKIIEELETMENGWKQDNLLKDGDSDSIMIGRTRIVEVVEEERRPLQVAIDGPSGSGKSTIAKILADKWNLNYLNTGLIYRGIALHCIINKVDAKDKKAVEKILLPNLLHIIDQDIISLNGQNVSSELRSDLVSVCASIIASYAAVREYSLIIQKEYINKYPRVIADGRDTTFNVLPNADVKIYLDTAPEVRAQRRANQNEEQGYNTNYDEVLSEIIERDKRDKERESDPLHVSKGSTKIDASYLSIDQVVSKIGELIKKKDL